jgi:hypothetical protein
LQDKYEKFSVFLTGYCKSAGTLFLLGANEIIASEHGELGPLDVQMAKKDHLWGYESGLTVLTALTALHEKVLEAYEHFFLQTEFKSDHRISLRTASSIATALTGAIFAPIYQQIDPMHVGEAFRSMAIARHYGERLMTKSGNFDGDVLEELISGYPTHGFASVEKTNAAERPPLLFHRSTFSLRGNATICSRTPQRSSPSPCGSVCMTSRTLLSSPPVCWAVP